MKTARFRSKSRHRWGKLGKKSNSKTPSEDHVFEKRTPSEEEFKLSAFGLPEPTFPKRPSWWSYPYVWLSAAALTCFALALFIRRWKQKAAAHTP